MTEWLDDSFGDLPDPRVERTKRHKRIDLSGIALCALICGADNGVEVEAFGQIRAAWLGQFLE